MEKDTQSVSIPIDFLTELLAIRKQYFIICEDFKIPPDRRSQDWVGQAILERIRNYLTAYVGRRSITERENGAAFKAMGTEKISDPSLPSHEQQKD